MYRNYLNYLPDFIHRINEFKELSKAVDTMLIQFGKDIDYVADEGIILTAKNKGLEMWENLLQLSHSGSVETRRERIISELIGSLPYTFNNVQNFMTLIFGEGNVTLQYGTEEYTLDVLFNIYAIKHIPTAKKILKKVLPANVVFNCIPVYNTHKALSKHIHKKLATHKHNDLREAVIM